MAEIKAPVLAFCLFVQQTEIYPIKQLTRIEKFSIYTFCKRYNYINNELIIHLSHNIGNNKIIHEYYSL